MMKFNPTGASHAVLIEVLNVLGAFRDSFVLVGGWVPDAGLARQGYDILALKFAKLDSVGPSWAAKVAQEQGENYEQSRRSAFEYAQALFAATDN